MSTNVVKFREWDGKRFHIWGVGVMGENTFVAKMNPLYPDQQFLTLFDKKARQLCEGDYIVVDGIIGTFLIEHTMGCFGISTKDGFKPIGLLASHIQDGYMSQCLLVGNNRTGIEKIEN